MQYEAENSGGIESKYFACGAWISFYSEAVRSEFFAVIYGARVTGTCTYAYEFAFIKKTEVEGRARLYHSNRL